MDITVLPAGENEKPILQNLMQLYLYDFSELDGEDVNDLGRYHYLPFERYFTEQGRYPFLVRVEGTLAGFVLVRKGSLLLTEEHPSHNQTTVMAEFFIMRKFRRRGIGRQVAKKIFTRFPGRWEIAQLEANRPAQEFWRKVIDEYTDGLFKEVYLNSGNWLGPVQVFTTTESP